MIEDLLLRWVWTLTISVGEGGSQIINGDIFKTFLGSLEIFRYQYYLYPFFVLLVTCVPFLCDMCRRFVWNFFRLENEHLNNCGEFRVVRDINVYAMDPQEVSLNDNNNEEEMTIMKVIKRASWLLRDSQPPKPISSATRRRVSILPSDQTQQLPTLQPLQVIAEDTHV